MVDRPATTDEGINGAQLIWLLGSTADEILPWGTNPVERDKKLREFFITEPFLASAIHNLIARNEGFDWVLEGPETLVDATRDLLNNANLGQGWGDLVARSSQDYYTQDKGAFIEIIREEQREDAPVLGLQSLDASRCWHTGVPETPVLYFDRRGRPHKLAWYQVITLTEAPAPHELLYGLQYCAVSRVLRAAQLMRNVILMQEEKTGGRFTKAVHLVNGFKGEEIQDSIRLAQENAQNQGLTRYIQPVVLGSSIPEAKLDHVVLELATLPDGFDFADMVEKYLIVLSMGLLVDYQELAPLPGGNLGTSSQSEILHAKARGKSAEVWRKDVEHALNTMVLPEGVTLRFDDQDLGQEDTQADIRLKRAQRRKTDIESGVLTERAAQRLAYEDGDIPEDVYEDMQKELEEMVAEERRREQEMLNNPLAQPGQMMMEPQGGEMGGGTVEGDFGQGQREERAGPSQERLDAEAEFRKLYERGMGEVLRAIAGSARR